MNARELADKLDRYGEVSSLNKVWQAARMLRQQADRIAELEKQLSIMEGEYPEPTVFAKITEFNSLEEAYKRIAELEKNLLYGFQTPYKSKEDIDYRVHRLMCDKLAWEMTDDGHITPTQVGIEARRRINGEAPYTHPIKKLSDEEIDNIGRQHLTDGDGAIEFARAIIKEITE